MVQKSSQVLDAIDNEMGIYPIYRALINPDKVKQDYDDKIISIDHMAKYEPGDVFEWKRTGTYTISQRTSRHAARTIVRPVPFYLYNHYDGKHY